MHGIPPILRSLLRDRGFASIAVATLALGIGANTAIFSLLNGVLLRPLPYAEPGRLVAIEEVIPKLAAKFGPFPVNGRHFFEWRNQTRTFQDLALLDGRRATLSGDGQSEQIGTASVSYSLFSILGVQPRLGRGFLAAEDQPGHNHVAVISDALWRRRYSADPAIIGKTILIDAAPYVVVGVLPPDFRFFSNHELSAMTSLEPRTDVFRPIALSPDSIGWDGEYNYMAVGRLKPGVTREQAQAEMNVLQASVEKRFEGRVGLWATVVDLQERVTGQSRRGLLVLMAAVGAVLLIVCVNLANLMLARALARRRDAAIRAALGASTGTLVRQVLTESLVLAAVGGVLGILASSWGVRLLIQAAPVDLPRLEEVHLDGAVLAFGLGLTLMTGLLFGILPALRLARAEPADVLRSGGRAATESASGLRLRGLLVASEVALSATLLIAAGLLLHSFVRLMNIDKGFTTERVMAADVALPSAKYGDDPARVQFYDRLLLKVRSIPGVKTAGFVSVLPLEGEGWTDAIHPAGQPNSPLMESPLANYRFVSPGYLAAIGIPLLEGRFIEDRDRRAKPAVISETVAKKIFGGEDPIGKHFRRGDPDEPPFEVVGVAGNVPAANLQKAPGMMVYVPYWYRSRMKFSLVVRTAVDPLLVAPSLRSAIHDLDPDVPLGELRTMRQVVSHNVAARRFQMLLVLLFALLALVLASLGIYGVVAYLVTQRRNEIGIRMALGASALDVQRLILWQSLQPVVLGLGCGLVAAIAVGRVLASLLFQVSAYDPATFLGVSAVLLVIAVLACLIPTQRATAADPASVLRYD